MMKTIFLSLFLGALMAACSNSDNETRTTVDTTIIGSDNPHPVIDTSKLAPDSPGK
jgi:hypothetical protein